MKIINLESVNNIRDISYKPVKEKKLIRSADLNNITKSDFDILYNNYNLRTIIDLRAVYEISNNSAYKDINYFSIPLIDEEEGITKPKDDKEIILNFLKTMPNDTTKGEKYLKLLESKKAWQEIFKVLLDSQEGSVLICCHQGKDRTGVVCALILYLLEVDYETIIDDYLLSNDLLKERTDSLYEKVVKIAKEKNVPVISKQSLLANKEYIDYVFNNIKEKYGSLDNFYKEHCGLDNNKINILKEKYCK